MLISTTFDVDEKVFIDPLTCNGIIEYIIIYDDRTVRYVVSYFDNSERKECEFRENELSKG